MPTDTNVNKGLEEIARLALKFGRLLMEVGGSAHNVEEIAAQVALGLGADRIELRVGYASLTITVGNGPRDVATLCRVSALGVNQSLYHALRLLASQIQRGEVTLARANEELNDILRVSKRHPDWFVAVAVGVACAAFGWLLDVDARAVGPIFLAASLGQMIRRQLFLRNVNVFISAVIVAFLASMLSGLGARWIGSQTVTRDMVAPVLLLVPGVSAFNAELDILEGRPTLGSARAVWVTVMIFSMAIGIWLSLGLLGEGR